jgi:hypothetical protein
LVLLTKRKEYQKIKQRIEKRFNGFLKDLGEDGQERLIRWADKFLELAEQNALTAEEKEDGTYAIVKGSD